MIDKIKEKIDKAKNDKENYKDYIKSFCDSKKVQEVFKDDDNFNKLKDFIK